MSALSEISALAPASSRDARDIVAFTFTSGGEWFGLPISNVFSVFTVEAFTPVPLGPPEIVGLINLRGTIVTAVSLRQRLGMAPDPAIRGALAVGLQHNGENFALIVDEASDVVDLTTPRRLATPANVDAIRSAMTRQVYSLEDRILSVLDLAALLTFSGAKQREKKPVAHYEEAHS
ncbi:MAG: chemotaxis protein CheW [Hyphomicrobiales bacterium]|nr:chemotaxis protein CheW [Hyphomicrobiales bacterium]